MGGNTGPIPPPARTLSLKVAELFAGTGSLVAELAEPSTITKLPAEDAGAVITSGNSTLLRGSHPLSVVHWNEAVAMLIDIERVALLMHDQPAGAVRLAA